VAAGKERAMARRRDFTAVTKGRGGVALVRK